LKILFLTPIEADVSVLFADIVGFTALSEQLRPEELAELLNRFFEEMLKPLFAMGGTLDKFIGDCIMAFFGAPESQSDHADRAVKVAKAMLERLEQLNEDHILSHPLQLRIAINSGKAVVGDVGSSQRVDYTVLGGTVNLASRLEAVCRPGACVISEETYKRLQNQNQTAFYPIGKSKFKGIDREITIYSSRW
jgi:Adenylate cyclase, family 3 (some proteins contain HAMP domain)